MPLILHSPLRRLIRWAAYPAIAGTSAWLLLTMAARGTAYWPLFPALVVMAFAAVAVLERLAPFEPAWNRDHDGDTRADLMHELVSYGLLQLAVLATFTLHALFPGLPRVWPEHAPMWIQILLVAAVLDAGLYVMHRLSHHYDLLWRLHAIHHSPERLYWLNGGRRHPLSALALAAPGLAILALVGATPVAVAAWLAFMSVHLALQHANLDYRLGPFRKFLAVAEMHRWHHRREFADAQVNYGEVLLIWDHLFGSFLDAPHSPGKGEVGLHDPVPSSYWKQLVWPWHYRAPISPDHPTAPVARQ